MIIDNLHQHRRYLVSLDEFGSTSSSAIETGTPASSPALTQRLTTPVMPTGDAAKVAVKAATKTLEPTKTLYGINEYKLANGLRVIMIPNGSKDFKTSLVIQSGSNSDPDGQKGIAHFVEHMCSNQGSKDFEAGDLDITAKLLGEDFNAYTGNEFTTYKLETLPDSVDLTLEMIASIIQPRDFDNKATEIERRIIQQEKEDAGKDGQSDADITESVINTNLFSKEDPRHHTIIGTDETLQNITTLDANDFHRQHYVPNNAVVILSGAPITNNPEGVLKSANEIFSRISPGIVPPKPKLLPIKNPPPSNTFIKVEAPYHSGLEIIYPLPKSEAEKMKIKSIEASLENVLNDQLSEDHSLSFEILPLRSGCLSIRVITQDYLQEEQAREIVGHIYDTVEEFAASTKLISREPLQNQHQLKQLFDPRTEDKEDLLGTKASYIADTEEKGFEWHKKIACALGTNLSPKAIRSTLPSYLKRDNARTVLFIPSAPHSTKIRTKSQNTEGIEINPKLHIPSLLKDRYQLNNLDAEIPVIEKITGPQNSTINIIKDDSNDVGISITQPYTQGILSPSSQVASLTATMLEKSGIISSRGKGRIIPYEEFFYTLSNQGAELSVTRGDDNQPHLIFNTIKKNLGKSLRLLQSFFTNNNLFNSDDNDRLNKILNEIKQKKLRGLKTKLKSPEYLSFCLFMRKALPEGHPLRPLSLKELKRDLDAVNLKDIRSFASNNFKLDNSTVDIHGNINEQEYERFFSPVLQSWQNINTRDQTQTISSDATKIERPIIHHSKNYDQSKSSTIIVGNTFSMKDPESYASLDLRSMIQIIIELKLYKLLREHQGLTYNAEIDIEHPSYSNHGYYFITLNQESNGDEMVSLIKRFLKQIANDGFTEEEIALAKLYIINDTRKQLLDHDIPEECIKGDFKTSRNRIISIKTEEVNQALKTMIKPNELITVLAA